MYEENFYKIPIDEYIDYGKLNRNFLNKNPNFHKEENPVFRYDATNPDSFVTGMRTQFLPRDFRKIKKDFTIQSKGADPYLNQLKQAYIPSNAYSSTDPNFKKRKFENRNIMRQMTDNPNYKQDYKTITSKINPYNQAVKLATSVAAYEPTSKSIASNKYYDDLDHTNMQYAIDHEKSHAKNFKIADNIKSNGPDEYYNNYQNFNNNIKNGYYRNPEEYIANKTALGYNINNNIRKNLVKQMMGQQPEYYTKYPSTKKGYRLNKQLLQKVGVTDQDITNLLNKVDNKFIDRLNPNIPSNREKFNQYLKNGKLIILINMLINLNYTNNINIVIIKTFNYILYN